MAKRTETKDATESLNGKTAPAKKSTGRKAAAKKPASGKAAAAKKAAGRPKTAKKSAGRPKSAKKSTPDWGGGGKRLLVVESPTKARTIGRYLGADVRVVASIGHIRDLPQRELGVDVENGFEPTYVTIRGKGKVIMDLRRAAAGASEVLLATDPDREGEAIAYHVAEQLGFEQGDGDRFKRVRFHEITRDAVARALDTPDRLDMKKVEAQQARRILDRLVGYQVSPTLWKPIRPGLSAGRVQTVALRLITEREAEIRAFVAEEYWSITADLEKDGERFQAKLHQIDGEKFRLADESAARGAASAVDGRDFVANEVKKREKRKNPAAPFTTSTLQQEAAKRLGFSAKKTMQTAQKLYEGVELPGEGAVGLITYMRTDSTRVSADAAGAARAWAAKAFGASYVPDAPRVWAGKQQRGAQEAHEAIRPTEAARHPDSVKRALDKDTFRLYELIWTRFVASQMEAAVYDTTRIDFQIDGADGHRYLYRSTGSILRFDGYTRLYREASEEGDHRTLDDEAALPDVAEGDRCELLALVPAQHFTQPPPRFSEASLVKELERLGIGRPSTYAQIISTLRDREYVAIEQKRFIPTPLGETVAQLLVALFPDIFNVGFTSEMEGRLDQVEDGEIGWRALLTDFYGPFRARLAEADVRAKEVAHRIVTGGEAERACPTCGKPLAVRWNRYGRFLGCTGYPDCRFTESLDSNERAEPIPIGEKCPEDGGELVERQGRMGAFIGCANYPKCRYTRPRTIPGLKCPKCGEGDIGEKRTRRGKSFWGCTRYPECDWSVWDRPVPTPCPNCQHPYLLEKSTKTRGEFLKCPECKAEMESEEVIGAGAAADGG
ncbi:MAG TPA: type I DNA topoisomerase [Longimicrobiales bacterium]|nr:type I DNA topoisomerase [Longimicrobiales bacterium]